MDAAWELGITTFDTADAYGGGRSETWIGEWLADEGPSRARRDHDRDEDVQPDGGRSGSRALAAADPAADRDEPAAPRTRARPAVHGACARSGHARGGDPLGVRRARPGGQGRRGRRVELLGRAARRGRRDLGARRPHALRVGAELVLAPRPGGRRDRLPGLPRARPRVRGVRAARGRLARRPLPARRELPGRARA